MRIYGTCTYNLCFQIHGERDMGGCCLEENLPTSILQRGVSSGLFYLRSSAGQGALYPHDLYKGFHYYMSTHGIP